MADRRDPRALGARERLRAFAGFVGRRAAAWGAAGVLLGAFAYLIDLAFVYALQILLLGLGSRHAAVLPLPEALGRAEFHHGLALLVGLHLLRSVARWCGTLSAASLTAAFRLRVRSRLVRRAFERGGMSGHDAAYLFTEATSQASQALSALRLAGREGLVALLLGATLFWIHPVLAGGGLAGIAIFAAALRFAGPRFKRMAGPPRRDARRALRALSSGLRNLPFIRLHGLEARERDRALARLRAADAGQRRARAVGLVAPALAQVLGTALGVALILAAFSRLEITPGVFVLFLYFYFRFVQSLARAHAAGTRYSAGRPALRRLFQWWRASGSEAPPPPPLPADHPLQGRTQVEGPLGWSLRAVDFAFDGAPPLFKGFDFEVAPGSLVTIEGPSGAGKSTLLNLLLGEDAPTRGHVDARVDGVEAPVASVRALILAHCAYAGPEPFLLEGTVRGNLFFGLSRPPEPAFLRAMQAVADCGFLDALPDGLEHRLTDQGRGLSAGQKQRLSLLRALLRRPKALVLDEATGHLDPATEARVLEGLRTLRGSMTIVCVSHREQVAAAGDVRLRLPAHAERA